MTVRISVDLTLPRGRNPFAQGFSKKRAVNEFAAKLHSLAAGVGGGTGTDRATLRVATEGASGTVTCAAVQNADTVSINGQALTATQHHARGTITPTLSGIDVGDTVTINTTGILTARQHYAKGTVTMATAVANAQAEGTVTFASAATGDDITVGATTFVATEGAVVLGAATYSVDTGDEQAATSFAAQVNAHATASTVVAAVRDGDEVTLTAIAAGAAGNAIVLTSVDGTTTAVSGSGTLEGGVDASTATIGETVFVGTAGAVTLGHATFSVDTGDNAAATSLAAQVNAHATASTLVTASASSAVVTLRAVASGEDGNEIALASGDDVTTAVSDTTLLGATDPVADEFDISGTTAQCCTSLAAAVNACGALTGIVTAATSATVVTVRAVTAGTGGNSIGLASSDAQLAVSAAALTGGAAVANDEFDFGGTNAQTATALAAAINASTTDLIEYQVTAEAANGVVTITAQFSGQAGNTVDLASSDGTRLAVSAATLAGGTETTYTF